MQIDIDLVRDLTDIPFQNPNEKLEKGAGCVLNISILNIKYLLWSKVNYFFTMVHTLNPYF